MTEYDYSPQAYERHLATQNRIANWVDKTEQHRGEFQSANANPPDLTRSGPGPASHSKLKPSPPSPRQHSGPLPNQRVIHPPPSESDSSSSSDGYYEGPWPAQMHQPSPGVVLPPMQQQPPPPAIIAPPHRVSHHRHRSHDRRRTHSHHSPAYYKLASPTLSPGYQYTYPGGYVMMPQYSGTQMPVMSSVSQLSRSAPASVTGSSAQSPYLQPQPNSAFLAPNPQPCSSQQTWSTYGVAPSPAYSMSTAVGSPPLQSPPYLGVPTYQSFFQQPVQQPVQPSYFVPPRAHQRIYDLNKPDSHRYYKRRVG